MNDIFGSESTTNSVEPPKSTADNDSRYRDVIVDIYAAEQVNIEPVDHNEGLMILERALLDFARGMKEEGRGSPYLQESHPDDYGADVVRVKELKVPKCRYGFIYTANDSGYEMTESLSLGLEGLEIVYPPAMIRKGEQKFTLQPGEEHIVILRATGDTMGYKMSYATYPRDD